jgi:hypothetical protein
MKPANNSAANTTKIEEIRTKNENKKCFDCHEKVIF